MKYVCVCALRSPVGIRIAMPAAATWLLHFMTAYRHNSRGYRSALSPPTAAHCAVATLRGTCGVIRLLRILFVYPLLWFGYLELSSSCTSRHVKDRDDLL